MISANLWISNHFVVSVLFMLFVNLLKSQDLINCDTLYKDRNSVILRCEKFFNYVKGDIDSFQIKNGFIFDTFLGMEIPEYVNDPITAVIEISDNNKDLANIAYLRHSQIFLKGQLENGLPEGMFVLELGLDTHTAFFSAGLLHGEKKTKFGSGEISVELYQGGKLEGPTYTTNERGVTTYFCNYENGLPSGIEYQNYDNGRLEYYLYHVKGKLEDGLYRRFDPQGKVVGVMRVEGGRVIEKFED